MELLTKLEEMVLIAVLRLQDKAYGISVYKFIIRLTGNDVSVSSVYFPLERLVRKGYLQTSMGEPTSKRMTSCPSCSNAAILSFRTAKKYGGICCILWEESTISAPGDT